MFYLKVKLRVLEAVSSGIEKKSMAQCENILLMIVKLLIFEFCNMKRKSSSTSSNAYSVQFYLEYIFFW